MMMAVAMNLSLSLNPGLGALRARLRSGSWGLLALCLPALCPGAARAQIDRTVTAGELRAAIGADPWHVAFTDAAGKPVLAEAPGTGLGPTGTLGFQTALGWFHATKVITEARDGAAYTATVATSDPAGRTLAVRIAPDAAGVIALTATVQGATGDVQQVGMAFAGHAGERFLGFGERSNAVDQRGNDVEDFVADGPYQSDENAFIAAFVPAAGFRPRDDATYFPVPWLLSTAGYGVLLDRDETSLWRLGTDQPAAWSVEVAAPALALRVFAGPRPADVLRRFSARIGRQPRAAAPFYFGPWWQPPSGDKADLEKLTEAGAAGSLANTYTHYLPCASQAGAEQAQLDRTKLFHDAGLAVTAYFNPMICTSHPRYAEARDKGLLTKNAAGQPYEYRYTGSSQFFVGQVDFTAPGADAFYASLLGEAVAAGYDGWMEDFGEYTPSDAVSADATPGPAMHNRYVTLYHRGARRYAKTAPRPLARFNRSGWTGTQPESQIVWGGDPTTDWGFDGLTSAVRQALSIGLSGISLWGSDIGGYFALNQRHLTPELLVRWVEFGFASGVMRTEANGFDLPDHGARPQITDDAILPVWRRYARLRTQLYPYLAAAERTYDRTGLPLMRHLALAWPGDPRATARDDEFLLGPSLLVAPVLAPGATERRLYLPRGRWVDLWRSAKLTRAVAPRLGRPRVLTGGADVALPAPRKELPLLVRAGAVLTLLPADVDTLTTYGKAPGLVHLRDRRARVLLAFPLRPSLPVGDGARRTYSLQMTLGTLRRPFVPCRVSVHGRALARRAWIYDAATTVLRATFRTRRTRLVVARCHG
jgi:alpha-glucosidase (family GH31 glycosyl hydrolase)